MGAGSIKLQASDTRIATVTFEDGAAGNVNVVVPKEGGVLASEDYVTSEIGAIPVIDDATEITAGIVELATSAEVQTGTDTTRAVTPAGLKSAVLGLGQTWQDVTASRTFGVTYTNSTGRPIMVSIKYSSTSTLIVVIDGVTLRGLAGSALVSNTDDCSTFIIPNGSTYSASGGNKAYWNELR